MARTSKPWFAAKRYGIGASLPIAWQGWATLIVFVIGLALAIRFLSKPWNIVAIGGLIAALMLVAAAKTAGGWRWRNGPDA